MDTKLISLKDFEISPNENVIERSQNFQSYIDQMNQFGCKIYWVMAKTGVVAKMQIEGYDGTQLCFIVDRIGYNKDGVTILTLYTLKSATKPLKVLIAFTRPLITEFADNLNLKHPLLPTISPYPTM